MTRLRPAVTLSCLAILLMTGLMASSLEVSASNNPLSPIASARYNSQRLWGVKQQTLLAKPISSCIFLPRGGSEAPSAEEEADEVSDDEEETEEIETAAAQAESIEPKEENSEDKEEEGDDEDDDDDVEEDVGKKDITSMEPVVVLVKTNMNNKVVDHKLEMNAIRTRNVESLKKSISRQLPGKPPMAMIRLIQHGQVLRDEVLVDELMDDEDEDDEDSVTEEGKPSLTLFLDMVPPVDPRYSTHLEETLPEMTTAEVLEAYALNEAAIWFNSQEMAKATVETKEEDNEDEENNEESTLESTEASTGPLVSFQLRQYANALKTQLEESILDEKTAPLLEDTTTPAKAELEKSKEPEVKGFRTRMPTTPGGPSSSVVGLRQTIQHYLNINWADTIRNFCLFLFFGFFGGRTVASRAILLLGAPLCFIIQARPVKQFSKELVYIIMRNPPSILLSLLPAPQQAMLALFDEDAMKMIYGEDAPKVLAQGEKANTAIDDEDEDESDEEEDETEDEEESDDDDSDSDED